MNRRNALFVLLAFALSTAAFGCGSGPPLDVASNVNLARFQGKWYEIARLPRTTQTDCHGTTAFYTQASDGSLSFVNQCNVGSATGPLKTVSMTASVPNTSVPAKLALDVGGYVGDYWILEVGSNYEYAVIGHPSRLYWWVLSRTPSLDATTMQGLIARATTEQFDMSQLQYTPQPPAGERNALTTPEGTVPPALSTGCSTTPARPLDADARGRNAGTWWCLALLVAAVVRRARTRTS
jgi:apolipoprotein D and lipocalin family protein